MKGAIPPGVEQIALMLFFVEGLFAVKDWRRLLEYIDRWSTVASEGGLQFEDGAAFIRASVVSLE